MRHELFTSLDELLAPKTLSQVVGCPITSVARLPFARGHSASGSRFFAIETNDSTGPRFVVKQMSPAWDWIMRATADYRCREALVWTTGLLDCLPPEIAHPVVACAQDEAGWAMLMHDVSDALVPLIDPIDGKPISQADHRCFLDALAALHAAFWQEVQVVDPALGFCEPPLFYTAFSPEVGQREADHPNEVVRWVREGWQALWPLLDPAVTDLLSSLFVDPAPLCTALARYPQTLVQGDPRFANLGILRSSPLRAVLIDWHFIGPGTSAADLGWYLSEQFRLPVARETTIAWYHDLLQQRLGSRFDEAWWQPQLGLSFIGLLMRKGWSKGRCATQHPNPAVRAWAREDICWWSNRVREDARWL